MHLVWNGEVKPSQFDCSGYRAPDPPVFSGKHRYMIFAYEQMELEIDVPQPDGRAKFDPTKWMDSFGGDDVLRGPVASIGFVSEF